MLVRSDPDSTLFHYQANLPPFPTLARQDADSPSSFPRSCNLRIACQCLPRPGLTGNALSAKFKSLAWPRGQVNQLSARRDGPLPTSRPSTVYLPTAPVPSSPSPLLIPGNRFLQEPCHGGARCGDIPVVIAGSSLVVLARSVSPSFYRLRVPGCFVRL